MTLFCHTGMESLFILLRFSNAKILFFLFYSNLFSIYLLCIDESKLIYICSPTHQNTSLWVSIFSPINLIPFGCLSLTLNPFLLFRVGVINHFCCSGVLLENNTYPFGHTSSSIISPLSIFKTGDLIWDKVAVLSVTYGFTGQQS